MTCENTKESLSAYIDGELDQRETALVRKHLGSCSACAGELESLNQVSVLYRELEDPPPPNDLEARVWASLKKPEKAGLWQELRQRLPILSAGGWSRQRLALAGSLVVLACAVMATYTAWRGIGPFERNTTGPEIAQKDRGDAPIPSVRVDDRSVGKMADGQGQDGPGGKEYLERGVPPVHAEANRDDPLRKSVASLKETAFDANVGVAPAPLPSPGDPTRTERERAAALDEPVGVVRPETVGRPGDFRLDGDKARVADAVGPGGRRPRRAEQAPGPIIAPGAPPEPEESMRPAAPGRRAVAMAQKENGDNTTVGKRAVEDRDTIAPPTAADAGPMVRRPDASRMAARASRVDDRMYGFEYDRTVSPNSVFLLGEGNLAEATIESFRFQRPKPGEVRLHISVVTSLTEAGRNAPVSHVTTSLALKVDRGAGGVDRVELGKVKLSLPSTGEKAAATTTNVIQAIPVDSADLIDVGKVALILETAPENTEPAGAEP